MSKRNLYQYIIVAHPSVFAQKFQGGRGIRALANLTRIILIVFVKMPHPFVLNFLTPLVFSFLSFSPSSLSSELTSFWNRLFSVLLPPCIFLMKTVVVFFSLSRAGMWGISF